MRRERLIWLALPLVTLALYAPALRNEFVNYDDPAYVTSNTHVQGGLTAANVAWAFQTGAASNWHPLTWLSHMLDWQLYGASPAGHHFTSILLHAANALLLFIVLRQMTGAVWRSAAVAAFFAWHPLRVESVAWVSERKDVMSAFFWLLTMAVYVRYANESKASGKQRPHSKAKLFYGLALLCFALGLMCKPMPVTLPFVLLLLDIWPLKRISDFKKPQAFRLTLEKLPFLLLAVVSSVVTFKVQKNGGAVTSLQTLSFGSRLANALVAYLRYVGKAFWPEHLSVLYPHPGSWPASIVIAAALFLIGVSVWVIFEARRSPFLLTGWLWFVGTLVPVIGLVQVGVQSMADRYTYVPGIGLLIMVCWGVPELLARWPERNRAMVSACGVALAACLIATRAQLQYWKDSEHLFRHAVQVTSNNYLAYNNLGFFLDNDGKVDEAMTNYQRSLEINPNYDEAQNNMGYALAEKGHYAEAIPYYEAALRIHPKLVEAHNNLGNALADLGKIDQAIAEYQIALQLDHEHADAHNNLGIALAMQGKLDAAVEQLEAAVRLKPSYASAHSNLGNALAVQHKLDEAAAHYRIALQLKPDDAQAHNNLGNVLSEQGKWDEAIVHYTRALQLNANNPEANYNLGIALLREGKQEQALERFREAVRLKPNYAEAQRQIAELSSAPELRR